MRVSLANLMTFAFVREVVRHPAPAFIKSEVARSDIASRLYEFIAELAEFKNAGQARRAKALPCVRIRVGL